MTDMGFFDLRDVHGVPDRTALASTFDPFARRFHGRSVIFNPEVTLPCQFPRAYGEFLMKIRRSGN
jgi:hypothetical protein